MNLEDDPLTTPQDDDGPAEPVMAPFPNEARPNIDHLIIEDDTPVESIFFEKLMRLLTIVLNGGWKGPGKGRTFAAFANVGLFAEPKQTPPVPDVMVAFDIPVGRGLERKEHNSYFLWEMGKPPKVVIEFVSDRRGGEATHKMRAYARMGVPYYVIFDPNNYLKGGVLRAFEIRPTGYETTDPRWFSGAGLGLVLWEGEFEGERGRWLRWCDRNGRLIPTPQERSRGAERRAQAEKRRAQAERRRAEQLAAKLRELGVDPTSLGGD